MSKKWSWMPESTGCRSDPTFRMMTEEEWEEKNRGTASASMATGSGANVPEVGKDKQWRDRDKDNRGGEYATRHRRYTKRKHHKEYVK